MKIGSLFAGIGGFDLGFHRAGFGIAWAAEWDKNAQNVLRRRFPGTTVYGDIREIDLDRVEPVDVICGGFPCQDLSVAGKRAGLAGERSGLFHDAMRIVRRLRPSVLVLENVPGLLSSNRGLDFATVLREVGEGWDCAEVAWRVLDSQFFGVAQRRRRVFIVAVRDPRVGCAEEILALASSGGGNPPAKREARQGSASDAARCPDGGRVVQALTSKMAKGTGGPSGDECQNLVAIPLQDGRDLAKAQNGLGIGSDGDPSYTLDRTGAQSIAIGMDAEFNARMEQMGTLKRGGEGGTQQCVAIGVDVYNGIGSDGDPSYTLNGFDTGDSRTTHAVVSPPLTASNDPSRSPQSSEVTNQITAVAQASCGMVVRRLMPEECELLQGFPVGWTNIGSVEKPTADSHRYKQLGNAVTVNVAEWLARRTMIALSGG